jgi:GNAT superfamily N-acetyltransferase
MQASLNFQGGAHIGVPPRGLAGYDAAHGNLRCLALSPLRVVAVDPVHRRSRVGAALCEHVFAQMRTLGAEMVEIRTGADDFHAPARALYESLGCVQYPTAAYYREL